MTLDTCYYKLEKAKEKGDSKEIKFWEDRIAYKLTKPKYRHLAKPKEEPKKVVMKDAKKA